MASARLAAVAPPISSTSQPAWRTPSAAARVNGEISPRPSEPSARRGFGSASARLAVARGLEAFLAVARLSESRCRRLGESSNILAQPGRGRAGRDSRMTSRANAKAARRTTAGCNWPSSVPEIDSRFASGMPGSEPASLAYHLPCLLDRAPVSCRKVQLRQAGKYCAKRARCTAREIGCASPGQR